MRHYIGGLIELCEEIEGNYMFEIRNWCPTRLTQVNRPQASRTLTHVTHSILMYICQPIRGFVDIFNKMLGYFAVLFIVTINVIETNNKYMHAGALFVRNLTNETYVIN